MDDANYFLLIRLGPKTSQCEKSVAVASTVTGCDVTNCATTLHGFNKHASSRREAVSDSRGVLRCAEKNSQNCSLVSIIRLVHFTIRSACNSSLSHVSVVPVARRTRPTELCPDTKHRSQSVKSFTSARFRPDIARVHIGLDSWHRQQFPNYQASSGQESRVNVFHLATRSLFRCHRACCVAVCSRVYLER